MNTWVCQYILECVDGSIVGTSVYSIMALWILLTGVLTLLFVILEPGAKDTPLAAIAVFSTIVASIPTLLLVGIIKMALNFESGHFIVLGAVIFTFAVVVLSIIIRHRKWR